MKRPYEASGGPVHNGAMSNTSEIRHSEARSAEESRFRAWTNLAGGKRDPSSHRTLLRMTYLGIGCTSAGRRRNVEPNWIEISP
jgi:hypothetical protein